mgnify:CR=1 FL=1
MDEAIARHPIPLAVLALLALAMVYLSASHYLRGFRRLGAPDGRLFDASRLRDSDLVAGLLVAGWFLFNVLPVLFDPAAAARGIGLEAIIISMAFFGAIVVLLAGFLIIRGIDVAELFGLRRLALGGVLRSALVWLLAAYPLLGLAALAGQLVPGDFPPAQGIVEFFLTTDSFGAKLVVIVMAVAVAPVAEEFIFRGYLYGALKRRLGMSGAMLVTAVLFALIHAHVPSLGVFFLLSLFLVVAFERSGSLLVPMAMHSLFNAVSVSVMIMLPSPSP